MRQISKHDVRQARIMRQITVRQLVRQASKAKLEEWIPCEITADGVVIAVLLRANDVRQASKARQLVRQAKPKATHDVNKPRLSPWELKYGSDNSPCAN